MELDKEGKLKEEVNQHLYFQIKAVLSTISKFGEKRFLKKFRCSEIKVPRKNCSELKNEEVEDLISNVITTNMQSETGI